MGRGGGTRGGQADSPKAGAAGPSQRVGGGTPNARGHHRGGDQCPLPDRFELVVLDLLLDERADRDDLETRAYTSGAKLDPKATDWPKLREELEALLKKPDDDKKDQDQNQQENQDQPQQQKDEQKKQDQKSEKQKKQDQKNQKQPSSSQDKNDPNQQPQDQNENPDNAPPPEQKQPGESAFGDMNKKEPPPPPPGTQKVGGTPDRKEDVRNPADPTLAQPLQKLEQLRAQDSPAQLFRLMEGERKKGPEKSGKNW